MGVVLDVSLYLDFLMIVRVVWWAPATVLTKDCYSVEKRAVRKGLMTAQMMVDLTAQKKADCSALTTAVQMVWWREMAVSMVWWREMAASIPQQMVVHSRKGLATAVHFLKEWS